MCRSLAETIDELKVPVEGEALVEVLRARDRLEAKIADAVGAFDAAELWDLDDATSMTAWLRAHGSMTGRAAAHLAARARRLRPLPLTSEAFADGRMSAGQLDALLGVLNSDTAKLFAAQEAELLPTLAGLPVAQLNRAMRVWRAHADCEGTEPAEPERSLHLSETLDGQRVLDGTLDPEGGEVVVAALRLAATDDVAAEVRRSPAERRADALVDVCRFFLDHQQHRRGGRHRPHLNVVIDLDALEGHRSGRVLDGPMLDSTRIETLLCDSAVHRVLTAGRSAVLDYGTTTRTIPAPLWNALVVRDEHCRFPDCDRPSSWCEGHHVVPVLDRGPTSLGNLVLACHRHHHRLHQPGWEAKLRPDATFVVTDPSGRVRTTRPPGVNDRQPAPCGHANGGRAGDGASGRGGRRR